MGSTFTRQDVGGIGEGHPSGEVPGNPKSTPFGRARAFEERFAKIKEREARLKKAEAVIGTEPGRAIGRLTFDRMHRNLPEPGSSFYH